MEVYFNSCGDGQYCGSFENCGKCDNCPVFFNFHICGLNDGYYLDFYNWPNLDYDVCVPCR